MSCLAATPPGPTGARSGDPAIPPCPCQPEESVAVTAARWSQSLRAVPGSFSRVHGSTYSGRARRSCQNRPLPRSVSGAVASQTIVSAPWLGCEQDRPGDTAEARERSGDPGGVHPAGMHGVEGDPGSGEPPRPFPAQRDLGPRDSDRHRYCEYLPKTRPGRPDKRVHARRLTQEQDHLAPPDLLASLIVPGVSGARNAVRRPRHAGRPGRSA